MFNNYAEVKAYAKLNLYLDITGKRENGYHKGYHELEGVMQKIELHDLTTVKVDESSPRISLKISGLNGASIPCDNRNIAYKAVELFREKSMLNFGAEVSINKNIPVMAGLGGSSADGAAVLQALNRIFSFYFAEEELLKLGAKLGADVPFCLSGSTSITKGIGEILEPLAPIKDVYFLIIQPNYACDTKRLYELYDLNPIKRQDGKGELEKLIEAINSGEFLEKLRSSDLLYNVFQYYENLEAERLCVYLKRLGALSACLTGSGSACFGVFEDEEKANSALEQVKQRDYYFSTITRAI